MTLDELRQLDFKDLPNLPLLPQLLSLIVLAALIFGLAYYTVFSGINEQINVEKATEEQLKQTFVDKKRQAVNLAALEEQLKQIESSFGTLLKQLPTKAEMEALLTEINQAGIGRGLKFELFRPGAEIKTDQMATLPIQIRLSGSYEDLSAFVNDVAQLSRIVTIADISLNPSGDKNRPELLTMLATAQTYRALEAEEQAARTGK